MALTNSLLIWVLVVASQAWYDWSSVSRTAAPPTRPMTGFLNSCGRKFKFNLRATYGACINQPFYRDRTAEVTSGIIASCLPTLPSCFRHFFQKAIIKFSCFSGASAGGTRRRHHDPVNHKQPSMKKTGPQQGHQHQKQQPRQWSRLGLGTKDSEVLQHSYWELEDTEQCRPGEGQIFQGRCFSTAEAKADVSVSRDRSPDIFVDGENVCPSHGILKTTEVNIESRPGERRRQQVQSEVHSQGQGQGQQI